MSEGSFLPRPRGLVNTKADLTQGNRLNGSKVAPRDSQIV